MPFGIYSIIDWLAKNITNFEIILYKEGKPLKWLCLPYISNQ